MNSYEVWCVSVAVGSNMAVVFMLCFWCWMLVKFKEVRTHVLQAAQDGDNVTHWIDGKNVVSLILGLFNAWFTWNVILLFVFHKMFDAGPAALVGTMVAITFTLLGIAWKKH
jgi:hypothetical protein